MEDVYKSEKSWLARHTAIKIIWHTAMLMGIKILPDLKDLVKAIEHELEDPQKEICTMTIAKLAEVTTPFGKGSFDSVFEPLLVGIYKHHKKELAAFLEAIRYIVPLADPDDDYKKQKYALSYIEKVITIIVPGHNF